MARQWKLRGYVIERLLGAGGTGEVWRARVAATGDPVALKRLVSGEPRHARRVESEAAMLAALEHPNLIRLHGVERDGASHVLVLDLAEGGSLADLLASRGRLTPGEVVTAIAPVAAALAYAHGQGVVHGDVSAANILFTAVGVPLLADLGVARLVGDDVEAESTPGYVDPAVAVGCVPGPPSDVFMLGGVALHALTGQPPWRGATAAEALAAARAGDIGDVAARLAAAEVPDEMAAIVARALSSDALDRGSAADFALDLRYSAEPVAVELQAGRTARELVARGARAAAAAGARGRPRGGRHAAEQVSGDDAASPLPWRPLLAAGAAPAGGHGAVGAAGVVAGGVVAGAAPPTAAVRPRPRPRLPGRRRLAVPPRRAAIGVGLVGIVVAVGAGVATWSAAAPATTVQATTVQATTVQATTAPASMTQTTAPITTAITTPSTTAVGRVSASAASPGRAGRGEVAAAIRATVPGPAPGPAAPTNAEDAHRASDAGSLRRRWLEALDTLDARRAAAFALRRPALLRDVYAAPRLLRADTRLLLRLVPRGCGLVGVHTHFAGPRVSAGRARARIEATARLPGTTLMCAGAVRATAGGSGPSRLLVTVVRTRAGPRIAAERRSV